MGEPAIKVIPVTADNQAPTGLGLWDRTFERVVETDGIITAENGDKLRTLRSHIVSGDREIKVQALRPTDSGLVAQVISEGPSPHHFPTFVVDTSAIDALLQDESIPEGNASIANLACACREMVFAP